MAGNFLGSFVMSEGSRVLPSLKSQTTERLREMERIRQEGRDVEDLDERGTHCDIDLSELEAALQDIELTDYDEYMHLHEPTEAEIRMWEREAEIVSETQKIMDELTEEDLDELDDFEIGGAPRSSW